MSPSYKVLYFTSLFPAPKNHSGAFSVQRVKALEKMGVKVVVACPVNKTPPGYMILQIKDSIQWIRERSCIPDSSILEGIQVQYLKCFQLPKPIFGWYSDLFLYRQIFSRMKQLISQFNPDIIISAWLPSSVAACKVADHFGIPSVIIGEGFDVNRFPYQYFGWSCAKNILNKYTNAMVFVSNSLKGQAEQAGLDANKMMVIHNGVDEDIFTIKEKRKTTNVNRILAVSGLVPEKGIEVLVNAIKIFIAKYSSLVHLTIIGDGPLKEKFLGQVNYLNLSGIVEFIKTMPQQDLASHYQQADLLCVPSLSESFGCVIVEAMACGTPVVASKIGGIVEIVEPISGILVPPGDPLLLAEALRNALGKDWNPNLIRKRVIDKFTWSHAGLALLDLIKEVVSEHNRGISSG